MVENVFFSLKDKNHNVVVIKYIKMKTIETIKKRTKKLKEKNEIHLNSKISVISNDTETVFCSKNEENLKFIIELAVKHGITYNYSSNNFNGLNSFYLIIESCNINFARFLSFVNKYIHNKTI